MFKLPGLPSPGADTHELADFAELLCWSTGVASAQAIIRYLGRNEGNEGNEGQKRGCEDSDDDNSTELDNVMNEISLRAKACGGGYPFQLLEEGTVLKINRQALADDPTRTTIYQYLLLSTRLNMQADKNHASIDGTTLLESISAHVLKRYLGHERADSIVFGTSKSAKFDMSVKNLCKLLGEGSGFQNPDGNAPVYAKDGNLDVVAWTPFADQLPGKLILFAQCKTGTSWRDSIHELQALAFCSKWLRQQPVFCPVRAFCIAESASRVRWRSNAIDAGLLFDRSRIVELSGELDSRLLTRVQKWTKAAFRFAKSRL